MAERMSAYVLESNGATREAVWGPFSPNSAGIPAERTFLRRGYWLDKKRVAPQRESTLPFATRGAGNALRRFRLFAIRRLSARRPSADDTQALL